MKRFLHTLLNIILVLVILLVIAAAGTIFAAWKVSQIDTNYPNISVNGIPVGELSRSQTEALLQQKQEETETQPPLEVSTLDGQSFRVDPKDLGMEVPIQDAVERAYAYGRSGDALENLVNYVQCKMHETQLTVEAKEPDLSSIRSQVSEAVAAVTGDLGESEYSVDSENACLVLTKGFGQLAMDEEDFTQAVFQAIQDGETELYYDKLSAELTPPDFQAILDTLHVDPVDARFTDDGRFEVIDEVVGCDFDVAEAERIWTEAAPAEEVRIPLTITWPEVTGQSLRDTLFGDLLGACTTKYPNSGEERRNNLRLCTEKINGTILYPGDVFSYNTVVGARTEEAGFKMAPAYVNGEVKDELGGGACQVSSTLYAATLFAFLETVERENHYFPVNYMQLGTDATVTIPDGGRAIDFKFKNNKNYPIKIVGSTNNDESSITFELWGTLEEDDYMPVEFDNTYGWQYEYDRVIDPAYTDRPGYIIRLSHETYSFSDEVGHGYRTLTWRRVYDTDNNLVFEEMTNLKLPNGNHSMDTYYMHE